MIIIFVTFGPIKQVKALQATMCLTSLGALATYNLYEASS